MSNKRANILSLLNGKKSTPPPIFSGLISVTNLGLERERLKFHEVHNDAHKMSKAAASTYRVSGFGSAVVPLDLCVEAQALGANVDFRETSNVSEFPRVASFSNESVEEFLGKARIGSNPGDQVVKRGRIPLVCDAIKYLKEDCGVEIVIGAWVPGPFTLLSLLVETGALYMAMRRSPEHIHSALEMLTHDLFNVGKAYRSAGADFLTIHEMGGSPGALGPKLFEKLVLPHLQTLTSALPKPVVLSACGRTNGAMKLLAASGADALSVDQMNDLAASRQEVPEALLFGNLDPVGLISKGTPTQIKEAITNAIKNGADAVWPGCDLYPDVPLENLRALSER